MAIEEANAPLGMVALRSNLVMKQRSEEVVRKKTAMGLPVRHEAQAQAQAQAQAPCPSRTEPRDHAE
jgi:hypothetical protein